MLLFNSPVTQFNYAGRTLWIKRDDLLHPVLSGNKARKLSYWLNHDHSQIKHLISYGGSQSNLMYALAGLAQLKQWRFTYYCKNLSQMAKDAPQGNLANSLALGMELISLPHANFKQFTANLPEIIDPSQLLIKQGGLAEHAEEGIQQLADEIKKWAQQMHFAELAIFTASGTGTSAYYLQKNLPQFKVYTTNCVGSPAYLLEQFQGLNPINPKGTLPQILPNLEFRFATPDLRLLDTIDLIEKASMVEFDLIYDPVGWHILLQNLAQIKQPILYVHCGGISGNSTMRHRYNYLLKNSN